MKFFSVCALGAVIATSGMLPGSARQPRPMARVSLYAAEQGPEAVAGQAPAAASVWNGVFTDDQAQRGGQIFSDHCALCHGAGLDGGDSAPALSGADFMSEWNTLTLSDMLQRLRTTMPPDEPGSLSVKEYTDIIAKILSANRFPSGKAELPADASALKLIMFQANKRAD